MQPAANIARRARAVRLVTIGLSLVVAWMFTYMAWLLVSPIDLPFQHSVATIDLTATVSGRTVSVEGTTDLPDGAVIYYTFWRDLNDDTAWVDGNAHIERGRLVFAGDLSGWSPGRGTVEVDFGVDGDEQPRAVIDRFGSQGEHLAGPQVYVDSPGDPKQLLVTAEFVLPG